MLLQRPEMQNLVSINKIRNLAERENVTVIGILGEKQTSKSGNITIKIEDPTGIISVLVNKNKSEIFQMAQNMVPDEIIGVIGVTGNKIIFANRLLLPDIPQGKELKKANDDVCAVFLSDLHVGSNCFLENEFKKFIKWINCEVGQEQQRELAKKIRYLFIIGDLVDGVGIYPGQEKELVIPDIYDQYKTCAELLKQIPQHINIIICAGNHDAVRIAEPQPPLIKEIAGPLWDMPNVTIVSNPSLVNIHSSQDFPGFDVLLYHGYSFDYFVAEVDSIRNQGGYDRADLIMKFLLQRRHLAPSHTSTLYIPDSKTDPLVINHPPDFFVTGHIHKCSVSSYRNISLICGSCWQSTTAFQERVGHHPEPCRVPIVNLKTRDVKIMKFI
jgi:DNA polymerase II small subunit